MGSKQIIALAIMGFVGGLTTTVLEGSARAYFVNQHASICTPRGDTTPSYVYSNPNSDDATLHNTDGATGYFLCPLPNDSDLPKEAIDAITVRVHDGSTTHGASAKACTVDHSGTGGACGTAGTTSASFTGYNTMSVGVSTLDDDVLDRIYLWVSLPASVDDASELLGYYVRDAAN